MRYRQLRGGLTVSEIGFGCSGFWGDRYFREQSAVQLVHTAFELGINHFDTGHNYCAYNAEPRLGRALALLLRNAGRDRIFVATKAGTVKGGPFDRRGTDYSPDYIEGACAAALSNLGLDNLDIFYLHGIRPASITDELLSRLSLMRKRGMFRLLGINTHSEETMRYIAAHPGLVDVALIDFNVAQPDRIPLINELNRAGVVVMVGNVLAQGHLIKDKIGRVGSLSDAFYFARATLKADARRLARIARPFQATLASIDGMTAAQAAMGYVLSISQISSRIFGTTNPGHLREIAALCSEPLPDFEAIKQQAAGAR